ncbi:2-dehydropantoate 2-reductase [Saccharopolyspora sp. WRP15-2]|uniref:2-dehydropantoate 2-reductase n=1 Tax=Saccharopolyspora oryzae TaxID=2997343 RepID=A0ABT4UV05_9PSEU|nr:2-dehydropantoate 2-reductase [Saccharopolyspora oryzae]MDA3625555.1 2-dehydropantoate 2-reductase [Saccharopolyspora oryzae]
MIAVVGVGAIGAVTAAALELAGHDLVLCARRERRLTVRLDDGSRHRLRSPWVTDPDQVGPVDLVVLAVKAHQTGAAVPWLRRLRSERTPVLVLQNGVEHAERLAGAVPAECVVPGIVWCTAEEIAGEVLVRPGEQAIEVPAGDALGGVCDGSFLRIRPVEDFTTAAWRKLVFNAVVAVEALTGRRAEVFHEPEVRSLARDLAVECVEVATAAGARLPAGFADHVVEVLLSLPPENGTSILYDRCAGRELEWDARNGVISRVGAAHGIPTPISDVLVPLLAAAR